MCSMLRQWRKEAGLTQRDLAATLGKPPSYIHKIEVGDRRIDPLEFSDWCRACAIPPQEAIIKIQ